MQNCSRSRRANKLAVARLTAPASGDAANPPVAVGHRVMVTRQGRHRYYRLAGPDVATALEALAHISPRPPVRGLRQSRQAAALAEARSCYDHLAGRAGVTLLAALLQNEILNGCAECAARGTCGGLRGVALRCAERAACRAAADHSRRGDLSLPAEFEVTKDGALTLAAFGIDLEALRHSRRAFAGACLDWTQRRPHLNGALGAAVLGRLLDLGWFERGRTRRALRLTEAGRAGLADTFGCVLP